MLIKCNCIRQGGTKVDIDDKLYHFAPNANGDHVCNVVDKEHIKRFMSIDAYEAYENETPVTVKNPAVVVADSVPGPAVGKQVGDPPIPTPPAGDGIETPPPSAPTNADTYDMMERGALAAEIKRRTGKEPHRKTSEANLRIALRELDSAA